MRVNKLVIEKYRKKVVTSDAIPIDFFRLCKMNLQKRNTIKKTSTGYMMKMERTLTIRITFFIYFT